MVVCIIALFVFGFLSIFSATHKPLAKEALDCTFKKMTLRPCNTGLDKRLKTIVSMKVMKQHQGIGKFVHTHFESISTLMTIVFAASIILSGIGLYNLVAFGNCNGQDSSELCLFNPEAYSNASPFAWLFPPTPEQVKMISTKDLPYNGNLDAPIQIIEVGCFTCPFTKATEPLVKEVMQKYGDRAVLYFKYFPLPSHAYSFEAAEAAECAREQGKFWEYKKLLFERQLECVEQPNTEDLKLVYKGFAKKTGLDEEQFNACFDSGKYKAFVEMQKQESINADIYGTPTFFVNGKVLVAPKTIKEFDDAIAMTQ